MEYETLLTVQGYAKFALLTLTFIVFYSYAYSIYKRNKKGDENYRDYEKYSDLVLDDSIESKPLEKRSKDDQNHVSEQIDRENVENNEKNKKGDC